MKCLSIFSFIGSPNLETNAATKKKRAERLTAEGRAPVADAVDLGTKLGEEILAKAPSDFFSWR